MFMDLNNMKEINDRLGHAAGDHALIDVANVLRERYRESDIIARMWSHEFAVFLGEMSLFDDEYIIVRHLLDNLKAQNEQFSQNYLLSFSIGVSIFNPEYPVPLDTLVNQGDMLMYEDKKRHKS